MINGLVPWILNVLVALEPAAPWVDTYVDTAFAIADAAEEHPVFRGPHAVERTAAFLLAIGKFESDFNPAAVGDRGQSLGEWQLSKVHAPKVELLTPGIEARHALGLIETSFRICKDRPVEERLGWYAWGRDGCEHAHDKSRHRMDLAKRILRDHPYSGGGGAE
jgi:hypothetical protein